LDFKNVPHIFNRIYKKNLVSWQGYLEKGHTINSEYYIALLERLNAEIKKKRPHLKKKKVLFHQDNALSSQCIKTTANLHELGYELLPHPPYSLSVWSPVNFSVCRPQKNACCKEI
jgi:[histone H3]-lysine36 N-dimethyltransferase SETMAR